MVTGRNLTTFSMKILRRRIFKFLIPIVGLFTVIAVYSPFSNQKFPAFTAYNDPYRTTHSSRAEAPSIAVAYNQHLSNSKEQEPPLNILASYVLLRAKPGKAGKKAPEKGQKAFRKNLFTNFIRLFF